MHREFKVFEPIHLVGFEPNHFSVDAQDYLESSDFEKFSLITEGKTKCFLLYRLAKRGMYAVFILASKSFSAQDGLSVKRFLFKKIEELQASGIWTVSLDNEFLEKWHMFIGMKKGMKIEIGGQKTRFWMLKNGR